jgi:hypothetical protein
MITSKFLLSVISLKFENAVNGKGKAKTDKASPACLVYSRLASRVEFESLILVDLFGLRESLRFWPGMAV